MAAAIATVALSALVVVRDNPKEKTSWKIPAKLTDVTLRYGPKVVGRGTLAGQYDSVTALEQFRKRPQAFKAEKGSEEIFAALVK